MRALCDDLSAYPLRLPHPAVAAVTATLLPAAVAGTIALGLVPAAVAGVILVLPAVAACRAAGPGSRAHPGLSAEVLDTPPDDGTMRDLLRVVPADVLFDEWHSTYGLVVGGEAQAQKRLRSLLLEEMRRRDLAGTTRWLS